MQSKAFREQRTDSLSMSVRRSRIPIAPELGWSDSESDDEREPQLKRFSFVTEDELENLCVVQPPKTTSYLTNWALPNFTA